LVLSEQLILSTSLSCLLSFFHLLSHIIFACVFVLLYGYNRIHMTNHFLSDVCFGTLITYLIYSAISTAFLLAAEPLKR